MTYQLNSFLVKEFEKHQAVKRRWGTGSYSVHTVGFWTKASHIQRKHIYLALGSVPIPWASCKGARKGRVV